MSRIANSTHKIAIANDILETLSWLSTLQYQPTQSDTYRQRLDGSITWFLKSPEFQSWILGQHSTLFCVGIPGAGKTVLAATAIHQLQKQFPESVQDVGIAWVYCTFQERASQTTTNLLGSIVAQLITRHNDLIEAAITLRHQEKTPKASFDTIKLLLNKCIDKYKKIYLVVDALDEYSEDSLGWDEVISELEAIGDSLNLMVTSRPIAAIEKQFFSTPRIKVETQDADARAYIRSLLCRPQFQEHLKQDS